MVQVKHISFKDWNPIGKPHKIPQGNSGDSPSSVKARTLSDADLRIHQKIKTHLVRQQLSN